MNTFKGAAVVLALVAGVSVLPVGAEDNRLSIHDNTDVQSLLENPTAIDWEVDTSPDPPATTAALGDMHAVYPVRAHDFWQVVRDYNNYTDFAPRVEQSRADRVGDDPPRFEHRLELSFRVLGFGADYEYYLDVVEPALEDGEFAMTYELSRSLDGKLHDVTGSWYISEIQVDGEPHTYARYVNRIYFAEDQFGMRMALRSLGRRDLINTMNAMYEETRSRGG